jgi:hypothetical protein
VIRNLAVDPDLRDREGGVEVELEPVVVLRGPECQPLSAGEQPGRRIPREVEPVVERVDTRVPDVGVEGVLDRLAQRDVQRATG